MGSVAVGALATAMTGAAAQEDSFFIRDRNVSVVDRVQAFNRSPGLRAGSFVVRPQLDIAAGYTSNVFALSDTDVEGADPFEEAGAAFGFIRPSIAAVSDWGRHEIRFDAYAEAAGNERFDSESFVTAGAELRGLFEIDRASEFFGGISFDHLREGRQVNNTFLISEEPVQFDVARAEAGVRREFGRARASIRFDLADYDYDDVDLVPLAGIAQIADQDFRDHTSYRATAEAAYALTRDAALIVRGQLEQRDFDGLDFAGQDRDSEGYRIGVGAEFDLTSLVRGEITVGYFERTFEDVSFQTASGLGIDAGIEWFPQELTTVTLTGSRDVEESPFVNAGAVVREEITLQVDHELRRNLSVYAFGGLGQDEFQDLDRTFDTLRAGVGARYYINDHIAVGASYDYIEQSIETDDLIGAFGAPFDQHRALVTVTLTP